MATPFADRVSYTDIMIGMDNLERSLAAKSEYELDFGERLSSLAEAGLQTVHSIPSSLGPTTLSVSRPGPNRDLLVEELQRRLKMANDQVNAKSDAFDLIYRQWQVTQTDLEQKTHEWESMALKVREKDRKIDNLQFRLFWAESENEENEERVRQEAVLEGFHDKENDDERCLPRSKEDSVLFDEAQPSGKSEIAMLPHQAERVPMELFFTPPPHPRNHKVKFRAPKTVETHMATVGGRPKTKSDRPRKKGLFAGFYKKSKKSNRSESDHRDNNRSMTRRAVSYRKLSVKE